MCKPGLIPALLTPLISAAVERVLQRAACPGTGLELGSPLLQCGAEGQIPAPVIAHPVDLWSTPEGLL